MVDRLTDSTLLSVDGEPCQLSGQMSLDAAWSRHSLFGVCALFEDETQGPQSGIGARQHEEDQDQHDTSSTWWLVVAEPCLFCGQILQ